MLEYAYALKSTMTSLKDTHGCKSRMLGEADAGDHGEMFQVECHAYPTKIVVGDFLNFQAVVRCKGDL